MLLLALMNKKYVTNLEEGEEGWVIEICMMEFRYLC